MRAEPTLKKLPVDDVIADILSTVRSGRDVLLKASPGSGKTTRVPPSLINAVSGEIWVLEPRRLAARMSATRVAEEQGEPPGRLIGWHMRFDANYDARTRVLFLTEGMFTARLAQNPTLKGVACIILDEFHERHQQTDVAFALCRHLQSSLRPDLRLIIMSATLDISLMRSALPDAKLIDVTAPVFPVQTIYWKGDYQLSVVDKTVKGVLETIGNPNDRGHVLVFLPGTQEIIRVKSLLQRSLVENHWLILELRGSLDKGTQDLAFAETHQRKIILATNIAESSITIPGVTAVIDTGLARVPTFNVFTGLSTLETRPVSKASIIQRQGRAGRTAPGRCLRLFSEADFASRPETETPEIGRLDLSQVYLTLASLAQLTKSAWVPDQLPWLSPPDDRQWSEAKKLLVMLDLLSTTGEMKRPRVATLPLHPRHSRFADACLESGLSDVASWLTAILASPEEVKLPEGDNSHLACDLVARYESLRRTPHRYPNTVKAARQIAKHLGQRDHHEIIDCPAPHELHIAKALLQAFPDRVMIRREAMTENSQHKKWITTTLCTGGDLTLTVDSSASHGLWLIALDASSIRISGSVAGGQSGFVAAQRHMVTMASRISPDDLLSAPPGFLVTEELQQWDERTGKYRRLRHVKYGVLTVSSIVLQDQVADQKLAPAPADQSHLREHMTRYWPKPFSSSDFFDQYLVRLKLLCDHKLISHVWDTDELRQLLIAHICDEAQSFADVTARSLEEWLRSCVGDDEFSKVNRYSPREIKVGGGHRVEVHYPNNAPAWIEARLQNFFGQAETPKILEGRVALTLHLLAPNMRALQVTTDLASFWRGIYPTLRKEYMRKYPRHFWPENPLAAEPPPPKPLRRR